MKPFPTETLKFLCLVVVTRVSQKAMGEKNKGMSKANQGV